MGSMNVYNDGSQDWGSIGSSMAGAITAAPNKAAAFTHMIETIKDQRIARQRAQEQDDLIKAAVAGVDAATLPAAVEPRPFTAADISDPTRLDAPLSVTDRTSGIRGGADIPLGTFTDPRELAKAEADRALAVAGQKAAIAKDPGHWAQQTAYGNVASAGVPQSALERAKLDFLAGKGMPTHIGVDESKSPLKNFNELDPATNQPTGRQVSATKAPGVNWVIGSARGLTPDNPLENPAKARERLSVLATEIGARPPTEAQQAEAKRLLMVAIPHDLREEPDPANADLKRMVYRPKEQVPEWMARLVRPPVVTSDPAAAAAAPDPNAATVVEQFAGSPSKLREEFLKDKDVEKYGNAAKTWNSVVQSAYTGNKAEDINIVYGFVKMMDDMTGVRDPETRMVGQTGDWLQQINTMVGQANGNGLDPDMRANIIATMQKHVGEVVRGFQNKKDFFDKAAENNRLAPRAVFPEMPTLIPYDPGRVRAGGTDAAMRPMPPVPETAESIERVRAREWATKPENRDTPEARAILQDLNTRR